MTIEADPQASLRLKIMGYIVSQAIFAITELEIPDMLANDAIPVGNLAKEAGANPEALTRFLRTLAAEGVVNEPRRGVFTLTEVGQLLRRDTAGSLRHLVELMAGEAYTAWSAATHSLRTGNASFEYMYGTPYFSWLEENAQAAERFDRAQSSLVRLRMLPLLDLNWSQTRTVVDVGGGNGELLAGLLVANPHMSGIALDCAHTAEAAAATFSASGVTNRASHVVGDFFDGIPHGADAYILSQILHDWDDDNAVAILHQCRDVIPDSGRLLVVEQILPERPDQPHPAMLLDLHMLTLLGGRERTASDWNGLLKRAGFTIVTTHEGPRSSVIEAEPLAETSEGQAATGRDSL